jgi:hypothetical protein
MRTLWHLAWQNKTDRPVDSAMLCQLAAAGTIRATDLVRRSGSKRWLPAGKVEGLFNAHDRDWFYLTDGHCFGPVSLRMIRKQAQAGHIRPDDLIWKPGHWRATGIEDHRTLPGSPNPGGARPAEIRPRRGDGRAGRCGPFRAGGGHAAGVLPHLHPVPRGREPLPGGPWVRRPVLLGRSFPTASSAPGAPWAGFPALTLEITAARPAGSR